MAGEARPALSAAQWLLLLVLAAVQFTHIVDFLILMPLATHLQDGLDLTSRAFGVLVSVYGFAACAAGLVLAGWLDRFDRKRALLWLYAGFTLGTFVCAVAPGYAFLLAGRAVAGAFGGVVAAVVLTIVGDAFPPERRGTAMGAVMSAFSVASIVGVPAGLILANGSSYGWRAPFAVLAGLSAALLAVGWFIIPPLRGHLAHGRQLSRLWPVLSQPNLQRAYLLMMVLVCSTFTISPYLVPYLIYNVGRSNEEVPLIYLFGGSATLVSMNIVGRLADWLPRLTLFRVLAVGSMAPILALTNLPRGASLSWLLVITTALFVLTSGRMVPAMAMITSCSEPRYRGGFLSVNSSMQQLAMGLAALLAGFILQEDESKALVGYPIVGAVAVGFGLCSLVLAGLLRPASGEVVSTADV